MFLLKVGNVFVFLLAKSSEIYRNTVKEEEVHLNAHEDITEVRERVGHFIT